MVIIKDSKTQLGSIFKLKFFFKPPKGKKGKGKKGKGKKNKTPTVIEGISTEEMTKEQVN